MKHSQAVMFVLVIGFLMVTKALTAASPGYRIILTSSDLIVVQDTSAKNAFSAQRWIRQELHDFVSGNLNRSISCNYRQRIEVVSLVGPLLSLRETFQADCPPEAHPSGETRFFTLNLARATQQSHNRQRPVALTSLFSSKDILAKLIQSPILQSLIPSRPPRSLHALLNSLNGQFSNEVGLCFVVTDDLMSRSVLTSIKDNAISIQIGLPGAGQCRSNVTPVSLTFEGSTMDEGLAKKAISTGAPAKFYIRADAPAIALEYHVVHGNIASGFTVLPSSEPELQ